MTPDVALDIGQHILLAEVDDAREAESLFRHRYGQPPPDFPHHVIAFVRTPAGRGEALCYIHFTAVGEVLLGGGACVDNRALRRLPGGTRAAIREAGGLYRHALAWSVRHFAPNYPAIFGYCGDPLAERADLAVGFAKTQHKHLLVLFTRECDAATRERLIAQAHAVGPF